MRGLAPTFLRGRVFLGGPPGFWSHFFVAHKTGRPLHNSQSNQIDSRCRGAGGSDQVRLGGMRPHLSRPLAASVLQLQLAVVAVAATAAALTLPFEFVTALLRLPAVLAVAINLAS